MEQEKREERGAQVIAGKRHFDAVRGKRDYWRGTPCVVDQRVEAGVFPLDLLRERLELGNLSVQRLEWCAEEWLLGDGDPRNSTGNECPEVGFEDCLLRRYRGRVVFWKSYRIGEGMDPAPNDRLREQLPKVREQLVEVSELEALGAEYFLEEHPVLAPLAGRVASFRAVAMDRGAGRRPKRFAQVS